MKFSLLPREEKFFRYFHAQAQLIQRASRLLIDEACSRNGIREQCASEIARLESEGDSVVHDIFRRVNTTFLTPLDPEDIHLLATHMDDVLDAIEDVAYRLNAYNPSSRHKEIAGICGLVCRCAETIQEGVRALEARRDVSEVCRLIGQMESETDRRIRAAIEELVSNEENVVEVLKVKEIYEFLERVADCCEDVADSLQNVMVKNG